MRYSLESAVLAAACALLPRPAAAQGLAERIATASEPRVQFTYAARAGVCGNGRSFYRVGGNMWMGSYNDSDRGEACAAGPVRVVVDRAGREVVSLTTYVGPVPERTPGVTDLGPVRAADAAAYLMTLAESADGRVSRDALTPATLADSTDPVPRLTSLARNQHAARETRRYAIGWLARPLDDGPRSVNAIATALVAIARDDADNQSVRQASLRSLARLEHGAGTTPLVTLARDAQRTWLAREALSALTASGDPRARQHLREVVRQAALADDALAAAIRGLGGEYATGADVALIRASYPKLPGERSREAALSAVATFGGADNARWLLALARDPAHPATTRRRALQHAWRGGTPVAEIVKVYDETTDAQLKDAVLSTLAESGEQQATDKLMAIARSDESGPMRRKAVAMLSRSSDERVKRFLAEMVER